MAKLTPKLQDEVLARVAKNVPLDQIAAWLKRSKRVEITKQALSKMVQRHRSDRADVAKVIAREHIARTLPQDLNELDRVKAAQLTILELAQRTARKKPSVVNVQAVKAAALPYLKIVEIQHRAQGLEQPDDVVTDLAALLAKA